MDKILAKQAGLIEAGKNEDNETVFIGTEKQWDAYKKLEQDQLNAEYFAEQEEMNGMEREYIYN